MDYLNNTELYLGDILKEIFFHALERGIEPKNVLSTIEYAQTSAFDRYYSNISKSNGGH